MALDVVTRLGDWVKRYKTQPHEDRIYCDTRQVGRDAIMEGIAKLRAEAVQRPVEWGRWALSIPLEDFEELCRRNPALRTNDKKVWDAFIASDEAAPYRVADTRRVIKGGGA